MRIRFLGMEKNVLWILNGKYNLYGTNLRLDEVHAAILLIKLKYLKNILKRENCQIYKKN